MEHLGSRLEFFLLVVFGVLAGVAIGGGLLLFGGCGGTASASDSLEGTGGGTVVEEPDCSAPSPILTLWCAQDKRAGKGWPIGCEVLPDGRTPAEHGCHGDPDTRWCCP